jgi:hypothetical protein
MDAFPRLCATAPWAGVEAAHSPIASHTPIRHTEDRLTARLRTHNPTCLSIQPSFA